MKRDFMAILIFIRDESFFSSTCAYIYYSDYVKIIKSRNVQKNQIQISSNFRNS